MAAATELVELKVSQIITDSYEDGLKKPTLEYIFNRLSEDEKFIITKVYEKIASLGEGIEESYDFSNVEYILVSSTQYPDVSCKIDNNFAVSEHSIGEKLVEPDDEAPTIKVGSKNSNSITFTIADDSGIAAYAVTETNSVSDSDWVTLDGTEKRKTITVDGINAEKTYYIWTKDINGKVTGSGKSVETPEMGDITDSNVTWTTSWEGKIATLQFTNTSGYTIAVSSNGTDYTAITGNSTTAERGKTIYVKITDGTNYSKSYLSVTPQIGIITYMMNDGTQDVFEKQYVNYNDIVNILFDPKPNRENFEFLGWATSSDAASADYVDNEDETETFTMGNEDVKLYANWKSCDTTIFEKTAALAKGYSSFSITGKIGSTSETVSYNVHTITFDGDLILDGKKSVDGATLSNNVYSFGDASKDVATSTTDAQYSIVLNVKGDLTINSGVTLTTCVSSSGYGGPKGLFINCSGTLTNNGTITMTKRGARAAGQNIFLWQNQDGSFEFVPAQGGQGQDGIYDTASYCRVANAVTGTERRTGGGRWRKFIFE